MKKKRDEKKKMKIYRKCKEIGCRATVLQPSKYCEKHEKNNSNHKYNRDRYKHDKEYIQFYKSTEWKKLRERVMRRDEYLCQQCKREDRITAGYICDHIIETKDDWSRRLDIDNVEFLCLECHNKKTFKK